MKTSASFRCTWFKTTGVIIVLFLAPACERPHDDVSGDVSPVVAVSSMDRLPDNRAGEIVRQSIAHAGGWEAWQSKKSLSYMKIIRSYDETGQMTREVRQLHQYLLHPQFKARITWLDGEKNHVIINNGEQAWKYVDGELQSSETDRNQAWNSSFGSHYVISMPFKLTDEGVTLSYAGEETLADGSVAHRVDVTYAPGAGSSGGMHDWSYYFDTEAGRIVANFLDSGDGYSTTYYGPLTTVAEISIPSERKSYPATADRERGALATTYTNEDIRFDEPLPASLFAPLHE